MIVAMMPEADEAQIQRAIAALLELGFEVHRETGAERTVLACLGQLADALRLGFDPAEIAALPGVATVHRISTPYRLASRVLRPAGTVVQAASLTLGDGGCATIVHLGPDGVSSATLEPKPAALRALRRRGAEPDFTSLREACDRLGCAAIGEVAAERELAACAPLLDVLQVAAISLLSNPYLPPAIAATGKPAVVARAPGQALDELLLAADTLLGRGQRSVALLLPHAIELADIPQLKRLTHLPIVVDLAWAPRDLLDPLAAAARAAGADALVLPARG